MKKYPGNSFYCAKKQCRKTAWDTPEYLTEEDWEYAEKVLKVLDKGTADKLYDVLWKDEKLAKRFFNQTMGWPEGYVYCQDHDYVKRTAFGCLKGKSGEKLKAAVEKRKASKV